MRGRLTRAMASPSFCFMPPDSWPARRPPNSARPTNSRISWLRGFHSAGRQAAHLGEEVQVFQHGQVFVQGKALRQVADLFARPFHLAGHVEIADG